MFSFIEIGKILKPYRHSGELLAEINPLVFDDLSNCKALFIPIDGIEVPFFIEQLDLDPSGSYIKLEEFNAPEDVKKFNGSNIYLRKEDLANPDTLHKSIDDFSLKGFTIIDQSSNKSYTIADTEQYPQQLMAIIETDSKKVLIPLVEAWIIDINPDTKEINMELPEGLIQG